MININIINNTKFFILVFY